MHYLIKHIGKNIGISLFLIFSILICTNANSEQSAESIIKERKALFSKNYKTAKKVQSLSASSDFDEAKELMIEMSKNYEVLLGLFTENSKDGFKRTSNRRDITTPPNDLTLLDNIIEAKGQVVSVGKIGDIFSNQGVSYTVKAPNNMGLVDQLLSEMKKVNEGLIFVNLVDFDTNFGHRRDLSGYASALEEFDNRIPEIESNLQKNDLVLITAEHGCDPSWPGSDHTREHVPVVFYGKTIKNNNLGKRDTFADMGQTIAHHLQIKSLKNGTACNLQ